MFFCSPPPPPGLLPLGKLSPGPICPEKSEKNEPNGGGFFVVLQAPKKVTKFFRCLGATQGPPRCVFPSKPQKKICFFSNNSETRFAARCHTPGNSFSETRRGSPNQGGFVFLNKNRFAPPPDGPGGPPFNPKAPPRPIVFARRPWGCKCFFFPPGPPRSRAPKRP